MMKKAITCTMLMIVTLSLFSQQSNPRTSYTQQDYLEKSKRQKTAGNVLLIGGAGLLVTGLIIPEGDVVYPCFLVCEHENDDIRGGFILGGILSMLSSIPLYIISGKTKEKAMSVSFRKENTFQLYNQNLVYRSVPAIRVKVDF